MTKNNNNITQREENKYNSNNKGNKSRNSNDMNNKIVKKYKKQNKQQNKKQNVKLKPSGSAINSLAEVGLIFKVQRKRKKMLQTTIAGLSNVGDRFISDLENGKPTMWFDKVLKVLNDNGIQLIIKYDEGNGENDTN